MRDHFIYYPMVGINMHTKYSINKMPETIKFLEQNIVKLFDINVVISIWIYSLEEDKESKIKQMVFIKLKSFCTVKKTINKIKRSPTK